MHTQIQTEALAARSTGEVIGFTRSDDLHDHIVESLMDERDLGGERWADEQIVDAAAWAVRQ